MLHIVPNAAPAGVYHRDLRPENLLFAAADDDTLHISNFALAVHSEHGRCDGCCGAPSYVAPEVLVTTDRNTYQGDKADVWSMGVTLFVMLAGYLPFDADQHFQRFRKIREGTFELAPVVLVVAICKTVIHSKVKSAHMCGTLWLARNVCPLALPLLCLCAHNRSFRPWFSDQARDLISKILVVDPTKRLSLAEVAGHPWFGHCPHEWMTAPDIVYQLPCPVGYNQYRLLFLARSTASRQQRARQLVAQMPPNTLRMVVQYLASGLYIRSPLQAERHSQLHPAAARRMWRHPPALP